MGADIVLSRQLSTNPRSRNVKLTAKEEKFASFGRNRNFFQNCRGSRRLIGALKTASVLGPWSCGGSSQRADMTSICRFLIGRGSKAMHNLTHNSGKLTTASKIRWQNQSVCLHYRKSRIYQLLAWALARFCDFRLRARMRTRCTLHHGRRHCTSRPERRSNAAKVIFRKALVP